ncbi:hypothetical protein D0Z00_003073 [Geotrichum galactomycetum]|uniref:Uncharacterized protein n=1 Tax=Geotrichum galactomycetum TaxID=27317 RepID=A0ACB6V2B9_9ASCO|nr:hypothetical protein D0Z00_003073 [Geotrichum candidum]
MPYTVFQNQADLEIGRSPAHNPRTHIMVTTEELKELKMKKKMSKKLHRSPKAGTVQPDSQSITSLQATTTPQYQAVPKAIPQTAQHARHHQDSNKVPRENHFADHHIHPSQYFPYMYKVPRQYRHLLVSTEDMLQQFQVSEAPQSQAQAVYQLQKQQHKKKQVRFEDSRVYNQALPAQIDGTLANSSPYLTQQEQVSQPPRPQQLYYKPSPPPSYSEVAHLKSQEVVMPEEDAKTMLKAVAMIFGLMLLYRIFKNFTMMESQLLIFVIYVGLIGYIVMNYLSRR